MIASIKHEFAPFWHLVEHYKSKGYVQINEFATNVYSTTLRQPFKICTHKNFYGAFLRTAKNIMGTMNMRFWRKLLSYYLWIEHMKFWAISYIAE